MESVIFQCESLIDFDDGHVPETTESRTKLLQHSEISSNIPPSVQVYNTALPSDLCRQIYEVTADRDIPWGTYVTKEEAISLAGDDDNSKDPSIQALAAKAVLNFIFKNHGELSNECLRQVTGPRLEPNVDDRVHGVQIWALPATEGSSVPYHIDYAEYIRYTQNVIVTPMYAGTVQCTPYEVSGGTFAVQLGGLEHYRSFGYKGAMRNDEDKMAGWNENDIQEIEVKDQWVSIPYKFNQGIMHTGSLPHLSGEILELQKGKRVIVGFNVFGHDIGAFVQKCPEHSDEFRKMVKIHRAINGLKGSSGSRKLDLERIKGNQALAKLLVMAKRQKVKKEWEDTQKMMTTWVLQQLGGSCEASTKGKIESAVSVSELLRRWSQNDDCDALGSIQPSVDDLHVHIHRLLKRCRIETPNGQMKIKRACHNNIEGDTVGQGLIALETSIYLEYEG